VGAGETHRVATAVGAAAAAAACVQSSQHAKRANYNRQNQGLEGSCNTYDTVVTYKYELLQLWVQLVLHHLQLRNCDLQLSLTTVSFVRDALGVTTATYNCQLQLLRASGHTLTTASYNC